MTAFEQLAHPDLDGLDADDREFLSDEIGTIVAGLNARAALLYATGEGKVVLAVAELQLAATYLHHRGASYRAGRHLTTGEPRWPRA